MFRKKPPEQSMGRRRPAPSPTDTANNRVFSYHANRSVRSENIGRTAEDIQPSRRRPRRLTLRVIVYLVVMLGVLGITLNLDSRPRIVMVGDTSQSDTYVRPTAVYAATAQHELSGSLLNSNKITVDGGGVSAKLEAAYPELKTVTLSVPLLGWRPTVYIQAHQPQLVLTATNGQSYLLASSGQALVNTSQVANLHQLNLPVVNDQTGVSLQTGRIALPSANVAFITQFVAQLQAKGIAVNSQTLPAGAGGNELDIHIGGADYAVLCNIRGNARAEAGTFIAAKQYIDAHPNKPSQYVDVRVSGRAYYK